MTPSRTPARAAWFVEGERKEAPYAEFDERLVAAATALCADARTWFPNPHDIGHEAASLDAVSVREFIDTSGGDPEFRALNEVWWGTNCQAPCANVSAASAFAWWAWCGFDVQLFDENYLRYKIQGGMRRLMAAIASDGGAECRFGAQALAIEQTATGVTVTLGQGETLGARAVVVATPLNTWPSIAFEPVLSDPKRELIARGHAGRGVKVMIRVRGRHDLNVALPETCFYVSSRVVWCRPVPVYVVLS